MIWTAGFRTAVIGPYEQIQLTEPRGFATRRCVRCSTWPAADNASAYA